MPEFQVFYIFLAIYLQGKSNNMKIDVIVVLFNPKDTYLPHLKKYADIFSNVFFMDNSTEKNDFLVEELKKNPKNHIIDLHGNQGIAFALKKGMEISIKDSADYVLTMDQDSIFPIDRYSEIMAVLTKYPYYGIIGLNFNSNNKGLIVEDTDWWLTSGNFINVSLYQKIDKGFDERLFIDAVDQDICHSFHKKGYRIGFIPGISIIHEIGQPKEFKILGKIFHTLNYNPIRYYYIFRNNYYLYYHKDRQFFKSGLHFAKYNMFFKILLLEKNKIPKLKACRLGKKDGKRGTLGPCPHKL